VCCSELQCVAECCSVLQCVAVCCRVLQCVAVCSHETRQAQQVRPISPEREKERGRESE